MSDNIPLEIQVEIFKRLPVKSLIQFRSVSKEWKSLIDSSDFVAHYTTQVQHLLVNHHQHFRYDHNYVSVVDDAFPQQNVSPTVPLLVSMLRCYSIIGSSHGLLCLKGTYRHDHFRGTKMAVLWNVSIRKAVAIVVPDRRHGIYDTVLGFGVCPETNDPKIVKIRQFYSVDEYESISHIPWQVEVFTLSTGAWRRLYNNLPRKSVHLYRSQVVIDGSLYWLAWDKNTMDGGLGSYIYILIVSFDITSEEFREVRLPDTLANQPSLHNLFISKLRSSLVVLECDGAENNESFIVWMMEDGISKSVTKLFTIYIPGATILGVPEFRKSGEPIIEIEKHGRYLYSNYDSSLVVYEPYSKHIKNLGFHGTDLTESVSYYLETLLLLDQPNFVIYDKGERYILKQTTKTQRVLKRKARK